ncbi:hypothetical protein BGZ73_002401, partial [Actinomortierella ambigua]
LLDVMNPLIPAMDQELEVAASRLPKRSGTSSTSPDVPTEVADAKAHYAAVKCRLADMTRDSINQLKTSMRQQTQEPSLVSTSTHRPSPCHKYCLTGTLVTNGFQLRLLAYRPLDGKTPKYRRTENPGNTDASASSSNSISAPSVTSTTAASTNVSDQKKHHPLALGRSRVPYLTDHFSKDA